MFQVRFSVSAQFLFTHIHQAAIAQPLFIFKSLCSFVLVFN